MDNPIEYKETSITTQKEQSLFLGHEDGDLLTGKKVLIVDDVISTGESLKAVQGLVKAFKGNIVASCGLLPKAMQLIEMILYFLKDCRFSLNNLH